MATDKQICAALTKTLHAYEAFMEDIEGELPKWIEYADFRTCRLCKVMGITSAGDYHKDKCLPCPLNDPKRSEEGITGCVEKTCIALTKVLDLHVDGSVLEVHYDAEEVNWNIVPAKKVILKLVPKLKKALKDRYDWILKKIDKAGYVYE